MSAIEWHKPEEIPPYGTPFLVIHEGGFGFPSLAIGVWSKSHNRWLYYSDIYGDDMTMFIQDVLAWATITAPEWVIEQYARRENQ